MTIDRLYEELTPTDIYEWLAFYRIEAEAMGPSETLDQRAEQWNAERGF